MRKLIIAFATFLFGLTASAQYYHTEFGHNRIQYKRFDWYYYSTNNFEVYYYPGGQEYAKEALEYLEDEFVELTDILGYAPYTKTKIFIYNSIHDLQQSNIGIGGDVFTIGGKTDFVKLQIELAYPGQSDAFKKEIMYNMAEMLIDDMMFGGSLAEIFQNSYLLSLPEWFIEGAARYLAYGWTNEMDDYVRDYLGNKKVNKLVKIQNEEAAIIGQSIWNYIALQYGNSNISNVLNLTRIIRNEETSISNTLGISFKQFLTDWQNFYLFQKQEIQENYKLPTKDDEVAGYGSNEVVLNHVRVNADGTKLAYAFHKNGKYKVNVVDLVKGKESTVVNGGYLINEQDIDYHLPLLDWQDNQTLGVLLYKRGYLYLNSYNLETKEKFQKPLSRFRQVESFSFNDNGKLAVISGDVGGHNDLYLISMRRNALKRITDDLYDDLDPVFIPGTSTIVFSSNRVQDSVKIGPVSLDDVPDRYNLFMYNLDTTTTRFVRLTNTYSVDRKPFVKNRNEIYYLSDQKGISNLYKYNLLDSTFVQLSNFEHSILDFDLSFSPDRLSFMMLRDGRQRVFSTEYNLNTRMFTPQTARQRLFQAKFLAQRAARNEEEKQKAKPDKVEPVTEVLTMIDTLLMPDSFIFEDDTTSSPEVEVVEEPIEEPEEFGGDFIDTDNYVFEDERPAERQQERPQFKPESFFANYRKLEKESTIIGPRAYDPRFSFNNLITSFAIDPIRGFCFMMEASVNDMLENHRLNGGVLANTDLKTANIYGEYSYLKYWMDFHVRFNRNSYLIDPSTPFLRSRLEEDVLQKYVKNSIEIAAALPLTNTFRMEVSPIYANTTFRNLHWEAVRNINPTIDYADDSEYHYGGIRGALVLDNTIERGFNIYQGTRGIIEFEQYLGILNPDKNFSKLKIDLRHYQKIHKELTLAGRLYYGKSMGPNSQHFLVGGMQNWVFQSFEDQGQEDPLRI